MKPRLKLRSIYHRLCKKLHLPYVSWRGIHNSPLFCWRKYTAHFSDGIAYGTDYWPFHTVHYNGHWIVSVDCDNEKKFGGFIDGVNRRRWPKPPLKILRYGTGKPYGIHNYIYDLVRRNE